MSSKSYYLYYNLFLKIKQLSKDLNIKIKYENIHFMTDFEYGLRKALRDVFKDSEIYGCFFHYVKNIWEKAKKNGLLKKN